MIHVCFGLHDKTGRYSKFTGTAMFSLLDNTNAKVTVHILHDDTLTTDNRDKFSYVAGQYGQLVKFYNVERLCADKIAKMIELVPTVKNSSVTIGALYRLLIPHVLTAEIKKIIYLDSDVVVNLDINELWRINLRNKPIAAISEIEIFNSYLPFDTEGKFVIMSGFVNRDDYFNSGILIMNLDYFRNNQDFVMNGIKWRGENPKCNWFDQDILNYLFSKNYFKLPAMFDVFVDVERKTPSRQNYIRNAIYHYVRSELNLNAGDPLNRLWMRYFIKTPWFDEETIGRLYAGFQQMHIGFKQSMANLTAIMSGKTRGFFVAPPNVDAFKNIFSIRNDEKIITADSQESLNKLLDAMKRARGKKLFFIMLPNFPFQILTQAGFTPGKDFVNGLDFLSEAQGVPLNSYPLIQAM